MSRIAYVNGQYLPHRAAEIAGADEAWQVDDNGRVTEGTSTNAWIVTAGGGAVTRLAVFDIIRRDGYRLAERPFTVAEAKAAAHEAFLTSTAVDLLPVVRIDGELVGDGRPGPLTRALRALYLAQAAAA